uniref:Uncharacterized protein n=1 Tax=Anopheles minimus TaxID=112268 RepID=A0A182WMU1_9DIPT
PREKRILLCLGVCTCVCIQVVLIRSRKRGNSMWTKRKDSRLTSLC